VVVGPRHPRVAPMHVALQRLATVPRVPARGKRVIRCKKNVRRVIFKKVNFFKKICKCHPLYDVMRR
jgi:hypothetical protein